MTSKRVLPRKKTKIVCTIGPASHSAAVLVPMIEAGMNIARLNFAHGDFASHRETIGQIREAARQTGQRVAIFGDLPGPKMRIGRLQHEPITLERGQLFTLQTEEMVGNGRRVSMSFAGLPDAVQPGDKIFLNDGYIQLNVEDVNEGEVECQVLVGGDICSYKGVNFPGIELGISAFTEQDRRFLAFAAEQKLDGVSQSFVQTADDITAVRQAAAKLNYDPFIIAKIERAQAVKNIEAILAAADGIMVARGDLGVEIPIEEIPVVQKQIIYEANLRGKPVITATQMLESMITNQRPTRAEVTDVANAILDGTDCVMLSGESAMGNYPVDAVAIMSRIAQVTEPRLAAHNLVQELEQVQELGHISVDDLVSLTTYMTAQTLEGVTAVFAPTLSGRTPRMVSRFRLPVWIIAVSPNEKTCQQLQFTFGVYPLHQAKRPSSWENFARDILQKFQLEPHILLLIQSFASARQGGSNHIEIIDLQHPPSETPPW